VSLEPGGTSGAPAERKCEKYTLNYLSIYDSHSLVLETVGAMNVSGIEFVSHISRLIGRLSGERREVRISSVEVHCFNLKVF
jgi:hypothetical protein